MPYEVLVYHADALGAPAGDAPEVSAAAMIDLLFRSVLQKDPDTKLTVITTRATDLSAITQPFDRIDRAIAFEELMLERARAQLWYALERDWGRPLAMLDSDILVNGSLASVFSSDFDVGLTWRRDPRMPFNGGVTFLNNRRPQKVKSHLAKVVAVYESGFGAHAMWWGDQLAVAELVKATTLEHLRRGHAVFEDIRYAFFDGRIYNYTPSKKPLALLEPIRKRRILHLKGERKRYMRPFWELRIKGGPSLPLVASCLSAIRLWRGKRLSHALLEMNPATATILGQGDPEDYNPNWRKWAKRPKSANR
jgi:hypothetical protein